MKYITYIRWFAKIFALYLSKICFLILFIRNGGKHMPKDKKHCECLNFKNHEEYLREDRERKKRQCEFWKLCKLKERQKKAAARANKT